MRFVSAVLVGVLAGVLALTPGIGKAQDVEVQSSSGPGAQPPSPAPDRVPPPPPAQVSPPSQAQVQVVPQVTQPAARGQWVYTAQYGWVWMPYGSQYTYTPTQPGASPYEYVYYPSYGWSWLAAPWVFGLGVSPYFGVAGPWHFGWYGRHGVVVGGGYGGWGRGAAIQGYRAPYGGYRAVPYGGYRAVPGGTYGVPARGFIGGPAGGFNGGHFGGSGFGHGAGPGFGGGHGGFGHGGGRR